jgi:hypothetical protein
MRWNNFYGIGNETEMLTEERNYHRVRSHEFWSELKFRRNFGPYQNVNVAANYQTVKIIVDQERFFYQHFNGEKDYNPVHVAGANIDYSFKKIDDPMLPRKGMKFTSSVSYTKKLNDSDSSLTRYTGVLNLYFPVWKSFTLSVKAGASSLSGTPEFFQLNRIGGGHTLRGYRRNRFHGKTVAFNQNELQFIRNVKSGIMNGKAGLIVFYDIGRVWHPGENSSLWHTGYGGGFILVPFNRIAISAVYGFSKNERALSVRISKSL